MLDATILIAARNAERTIGRAARSALQQGEHAILLVDDYSSDGTVAAARAVAGDRLEVVQPPRHGPLGFTRQTALDRVRTRFAIWLDADDELLPGRVDRMIEALDTTGTDVAADAMELCDGESGVPLGVVKIPLFLLRAANPVRLFEHNYLPGPGVIGLRVRTARAIGYDTELHGAEDFDLLLRLFAAGARFAMLDAVGYRAYAYPTSLSRDLANQRAQCRRALLKHEYEWVRAQLRAAGYAPAIAAWALVAMAVHRGEYRTAWQFLCDPAVDASLPGEVLEPDGPCPLQEGWRRDFMRGTLRLLLGDPQAARSWLDAAERREPTAESANNLGVAHARLGALEDARLMFEAARDRFPDYLDAAGNLDQAEAWSHDSNRAEAWSHGSKSHDSNRADACLVGPSFSLASSWRITTLPLRRHTYRCAFPREAAAIPQA